MYRISIGHASIRSRRPWTCSPRNQSRPSSNHRWALIAMREDYMGGLDRFLPYVPGQLRATFRLDLLDREAAGSAIRDPADRCGAHFAEDAADTLIEDLQRVRTGALDGEATRVGAY